ncbi:MAG: protease modulator HflC [Gammaproteobacteria bacterium]|nr:MAG: protease modulator HflC [Gammaproteobacteria bacterium]
MNKKIIVVIVLALSLFLYLTFTFRVHESKTALKTALGKIVQVDYKPGLHYRIPIYHTITTFDTRILTLDTSPERVLTSEKKNVLVDYFVKWRIIDTKNYYLKTQGDTRRAMSLLSEFSRRTLLDEFGKRTVQEVISGERLELMDDVKKQTNIQALDYGIEIVDVRVKKVDFPSEVNQSVFERMEKERATVATSFRSEGQEQAKFIRADADRQKAVILATARSQSEKIRGDGDAVATKTYADAYSQDSDFYAFYRSLEAYRGSFTSKSDIMVLQPDSEFFKFFK